MELAPHPILFAALFEPGRALDGADRAQPDFYKTHYFRGQLAKSRGEYDAALRELSIVNERFPLDRATITSIARVHYLRGDFSTSLDWCRRELAIDPEDFTAHYNAALCFRALGNADSGAFHEAEHHSYRMDEKVNEYALEYRLNHPEENVEADPIHEHLDDNAAAAAAAVPGRPRRRPPSRIPTPMAGLRQ